jgi:ABC-type bacteriocin/lantibiotic exporter with double-glycine peptidase domain
LGIQAIINLIQGGQVNTAWIVLVVFVVLGIAFTGVLQIFQLRIMENLQQKIFSRAAFEMAFRIPRIKMEAIYKHYAPELMNRFFDTISVQKGLSKILIDISIAALNIIFGLILLSFYHSFFIIFSFFLIFLIYGIFQLTAKRGLSTSLEESRHKYRVAHWLEEVARTATTFKLAGNTDLPLHRTNGHVDHYLEAREGHFKVLVQQFSLMVIFKVIVATGLLAIGGILVMEQRMNIGQFVAAEIIILLVMNSVEKLILRMETIYDVLTALEKIGQVTDLELESSEGKSVARSEINGGLSIQLENVSFTYPEYHKPTLQDLTLDIKSSERIMLTGENGAGKSTLLHILAALYDVQKGNISFDAIPKDNLDLSTLREVIGDYFAQEQLFEGSVLENLAMGRKAANFENIKWAVHKVGLEGFINSLPNGYDTILDPQGKRLPRSTMQKLLIARCIADQPKLILLEDAFEHLDEEDRSEIIDFLMDPANDWTIVAVSSNKYLASKVDRRVYLDDGRVSRIEENDHLEAEDQNKPNTDA